MAIALVAACASAAPATAVTRTFDVAVTESDFDVIQGIPNPPLATLPPVGATGTVTIDIPLAVPGDATPLPAIPDGLGNLFAADASVSIGSLSGALDPTAGGVTDVFDGLLRISNGTFSSIGVTFPTTEPASFTFAGSFRVFGPGTGDAPATFGDVASLLLDPAATVRFSFNGTTFDGIDTSLVAESVAPVIPLPAGAWLLIGGLAMLPLVRRSDTAA